jgi:putative ABC transport system ATP-binding protein
VSCEIAAGEFVAIVGNSGVGKSTFLNCLAGLDSWQQGRVLHNGTDLSTLDEARRAIWRRAHLGFVFQAFHVLPHLDVAQNIALPLMLLGAWTARVSSACNRCCKPWDSRVWASACPSSSAAASCSVAIARALVHSPPLLLADEPTGNLDPSTAQQIMDLLLQQTRDNGTALVLVTHSAEAARRADRVLRLTAGGMQAELSMSQQTSLGL